jgi:hypothetical protein
LYNDAMALKSTRHITLKIPVVFLHDASDKGLAILFSGEL